MYHHISKAELERFNKMSNNAKKVTPADVAAQAAEEKLVVPAQSSPEDLASAVDEVFEGEKSADEGAKGRLKARLASLTSKLKENKRAVAGVGAAAVVAGVALVRYAKKQAEAKLQEELPVLEPELEEISDIHATADAADESAA